VEVHFTTALWVKILVGQKEVWLPPRLPKSTMLPIEVLSSNLVNAGDIDPKSVHIGALGPASTRLVIAGGKCRALLCEFDLAEIIAHTHEIPPKQRFPLEIILEGKTTYGERIYGHHALPIEK
jgi:hypothetical protein